MIQQIFFLSENPRKIASKFPNWICYSSKQLLIDANKNQLSNGLSNMETLDGCEDLHMSTSQIIIDVIWWQGDLLYVLPPMQNSWVNNQFSKSSLLLFFIPSLFSRCLLANSSQIFEVTLKISFVNEKCHWMDNKSMPRIYVRKRLNKNNGKKLILKFLRSLQFFGNLKMKFCYFF